MNDFFTNIGPNVENKIPKSKHNFQEYLKNPNLQTLMHQPCDAIEVIDIIKDLKTSKACGPYSIPVNLLKSSYTILVPILTTLINKSLIQGEFPNLLKYANVCPIYKKGDVDKCENYQPISLLSNISKFLKRLCTLGYGISLRNLIFYLRNNLVLGKIIPLIMP